MPTTTKKSIFETLCVNVFLVGRIYTEHLYHTMIDGYKNSITEDNKLIKKYSVIIIGLMLSTTHYFILVGNI